MYLVAKKGYEYNDEYYSFVGESVSSSELRNKDNFVKTRQEAEKLRLEKLIDLFKSGIYSEHHKWAYSNLVENVKPDYLEKYRDTLCCFLDDACDDDSFINGLVQDSFITNFFEDIDYYDSVEIIEVNI